MKDLHQDEAEAIAGYQKAIPKFQKASPETASELKHILGEEKEHKAMLKKRSISMNKSRASVHLGGAKKKSAAKKKKRPVHRMEIRHGASGGHIITHHFKPEEDETGAMQTPESEEHVMPPSEGNQMLAQHVAEHMAPPVVAPAGPQVGGQPVATPSEGA